MDSQERLSKRRKPDTSHSPPMIEGATAQVRGWSYGNLSKRDATRFFRAVSYSCIYLLFCLFDLGCRSLLVFMICAFCFSLLILQAC